MMTMMVLLPLLMSTTTWAQARSSTTSKTNVDSAIESELNQSEDEPTLPLKNHGEPLPDIKTEIESEQAVPHTKEKRKAVLDEEQRTQEDVIKKHKEQEIKAGANVNRFPKEEPLFEKPPGPVQGGTVEVSHPNAAKGLIRINKDGSYQYGLRTKEGKQAASFRVSVMQPPNITNNVDNITYKSMYGSASLVGAVFDYEWRPLHRFGTFGIQVGTGFWTVQGTGVFKQPPARTDQPQDKYTLVMIPLNLFAIYRFDYSRKQWLVPYVKGGGTLYGLAELSSDYSHNNFAHSEAFGGGGGVMLSLGRLSPASGYTMASEYGLADMWITLEARAMVSPEKNIDFSSEVVELGFTVDY